MATRYIARLGERTVEVDVTEVGDGYLLAMEGKEIRVDCRTVGGGIRTLLIDGRSYETGTMPTRDGIDVYVSGDVFRVKVADELWARVEEAAHTGPGGPEEIVSPMPGSVVRIAVEPGQVVTPGHTVAVVEAMKMQNDIAAARGGTVSEIRVEAGEVVDQGSVLVVLTSPEEPADG
jgi:3-methylcrotonyl-CoA carboxylase alpha subunit